MSQHDKIIEACTSNDFSADDLETLLKTDSSTINDQDGNGNTAVYHLIVNSKMDDNMIIYQKMLVLIKYGAEVNINCNDDNREGAQMVLPPPPPRPLFHVLSHKYVNYENDENIFKLFVDKGVDPNVLDDEGNTALFFAASINNIQDLIDVGTDINAQNSEGDTILHILCRTDIPNKDNISNFTDDPESLYDMIEYLLNRGGKLFIENRIGKNVISVTKFSTPILTYIKKYIISKFSMYKSKSESIQVFIENVTRYVNILAQIQRREQQIEEYDFDSFEFPELTAEIIEYLKHQYETKTNPDMNRIRTCIKLLDPSINLLLPEEQAKESILHIIQEGAPLGGVSARFDMPVKPYVTTIEDVKKFIKAHLTTPGQPNPKLEHALRVIHKGKEIKNNRLTIDDSDIPNNGTIYFVFNIRKRGLGGKTKRKRKLRKTRK